MPNATYQPFNVAKTIYPGHYFKVTTPSGDVFFLLINNVGEGSDTTSDGEIDTYTLEGTSGIHTKKFTVEANSHNFQYKLNWYNCFSFGNGVESNRIRDVYNEKFLFPGVKVSTSFEDYKEETNTNSLIFSGIYNSISSLNNLNQFIAAEKITKELNPTYGSIQKLHTRDSDLVVLCEDKILKVLANKDAVFNADGNVQLTANQNVLGQTIPFVGDYGISKNPESFATEAYRSYFTDKQRGVVLRLSKDGLTPISSHGMKDYFRDTMSDVKNLIGSYDIKKDEYNLTTSYSSKPYFRHNDASSELNVSDWVFQPGENAYEYSTVSPTANDRFRIPTHKNNLGVKIDDDGEYKISFELQQVVSFGNTLSGKLKVYLFNDDAPLGAKAILVAEIDDLASEDFGNGIGIGGLFEFIINKENYPNGFVNTATGSQFPDNYDARNSIVFEGATSTNNGNTWNGVINNVNISRIDGNPTTVTFKENVKGWTSFKSFIPDYGLSCSGDYYTISNGSLWKHHDDSVDRNTFYGVYEPSSINVLLNDAPSRIKTFHTIDYEGSQSKINLNENTSVDKSYYNLKAYDGWSIENIETNEEKGYIGEFVEKEGKWFNYIKGFNALDNGVNLDTSGVVDKNVDFSSSNVQALGVLKETPQFENFQSGSWITLQTLTLKFNSLNSSLQIGDIAYYIKSYNLPSTSMDDVVQFPFKITDINKNANTIVVNNPETNYVTGVPLLEQGDLILFSKNAVINSSSLTGYYADVKFTNNSKEKVELFTVASEISESSK